MDRLWVGDDHQFNVVQEFPRVAVDAEGMQRHGSRHIERLTWLDTLQTLLLLLLGELRFDRRGHPDLLAVDHRRRPAPAGERCLPGDVFSFAPRHRQVAGCGGMALAVGTPPLRPVGCGGTGAGHAQRRDEEDESQDGRGKRLHRSTPGDGVSAPKSISHGGATGKRRGAPMGSKRAVAQCISRGERV